MTTSESKGRFFTKQSIRITNRIESIRIANWNALVDTAVQATSVAPSRMCPVSVISANCMTMKPCRTPAPHHCRAAAAAISHKRDVIH